MGGVLSSGSDEITREQQYVSMLYGRVDELRARAAAQLGEVLAGVGSTPQHFVERDVFARSQAGRIAQLDGAESGLCFGRLDLVDGVRRYVGRVGLFDEDGADDEPLLIDWRAGAARPFYVATAAAPLGVRRRRHIRTRLRTVVGLDDDVLDVLDAADGRADLESHVVGEGALLAALTAQRTGRMRDVVETIQGEQDHAIRAEMRGVLVVQGGPGTGKTAVALHRAAYLLYTHRERLARSGVLIVGPNHVFLRYISNVLPALGETGVVLGTLGDLFPGVVGDQPESTETAEIKGRAEMADVIAAAVAARQRVPDSDVVEIAVDNETYRLDRETCRVARDKARQANKRHNLARPVFLKTVLIALAAQSIEQLNDDPFAELTRGLVAAIARDLGESAEDLPDEDFLDGTSVADLAARLGQEPAVLDVLDELWPDVTPQRLLEDLFSSQDRLDEAAPGLTAAERALLLRDAGSGWSTADVPLLDEAAELLGVDTSVLDAVAQAERRRRIEYAQGVLDVSVGSRSTDLEDPREEMVTAADLLSAEMLAERQESADQRSAAERAVGDRTWAFGHVVVDEAQELSAMAWRLLMRRCPSRSMTLVGDVAQTGDPAGTRSWGRALAPYVGDRWRMAELTVNYRTPEEVMAVAAEVLARIDPGLKPPRSVRSAGVEPWEELVDARGLAGRLAEIAAVEDAAAGEGRLAIIVPTARLGELAYAVASTVPGASWGDDPDLEARTVVLGVRQAKGLEFDRVVVVDPDGIVVGAPRGENDLYVALTRSTERLGVVKLGAEG